MSSETSLPFPSASRDRVKLSSQRERGSDSGETASVHPVFEVHPDDRARTNGPDSGCFVGAEDPTDDNLLERVSHGDREALSLLFRRHAKMVRVLSERILRDRGEAQDLVQEVFLFVLHRAALFDPAKGSARSWLVQVTYHRAFDRRRHLTSRRFYSNVEFEEAILHAEEPVSLTTLYEDTIEAAFGRDALSRIEAALSDVQRRVLYLHFYEGQTISEIATTLGQSAGNVRNHYYRALEKIRREVFTSTVRRK